MIKGCDQGPPIPISIYRSLTSPSGKVVTEVIPSPSSTPQHTTPTTVKPLFAASSSLAAAESRSFYQSTDPLKRESFSITFFDPLVLGF